MSHHNQLWNAVESVGVSIKVNERQFCDPKFGIFKKKIYGFYSAAHKLIVICQEAAVAQGKYNVGQVTWSEEDLDTLRHEAHHLAQDCRDTTLNAELHAVYKQPVEFALSVLGQDRAQSIVRSYKGDGASDHVVTMELEAFAVAQLNNPLEQVEDIKRYCF